MSLPSPFSIQKFSKENEAKCVNKKEQEINSKESSTSKNTEMNILENLDIQKIKELNSKCVEFIFEEKTDISLEILKKIELFLESNLIESKFIFDKKLMIIILHNLACCYQKLKDYDNCIIYLDGVIYHFDKELEKKHQIKFNQEYFIQNLTKDQSNYSLLGDLILELRFSAKFHLQMCAALSQANRHIEALKHAKLAGLICEDNLIKTYYLFIQMKLKNIFSIENKNNSNNINNEKEEENDINNSEKMKLIQKIVNDLFNKITNLRKHFYNVTSINNNNIDKTINNSKENCICFDSYLKYRKNEIHKYQKNIALLNNIRNVFGAEIKNDDWIKLLNIGNIMYLSPLNEEDLDLESDPKYELLRDAILEKVVMLTVSYFCIAMEMKQLSPDQNNKKLNGEFFHYQAVYFSDLYLPVSCPIVKHYINSYYKHYEKDLDIVPEGKTIDYKIDLFRNEIEINKDIQSFVKLQKINYTNNNTYGAINNNNINFKKINNKSKDNNNSNIKNENINVNNNTGVKKGKIPLGLKLSLNLENILNKNNNNEINNSNSKNKKLSSSNDKKKLSKSNNKNTKNNDNYEIGIFPNKNNINIAEKSKIKEMPKFKLNFNKLNNLNSSNEESNRKEKEKNIQNIKSKIKKIQYKISNFTKTNRHSASINKSKNNNFKKNKGYKTERPISNKRPINICETLIITKKSINKGIDIKRNSFIKSYYNKHLSKTSRYQNKKSPTPINKGKIKGNLTDRVIVNKNKSLKRSNEKKEVDNNYYKNNIGYLTQRELTHFKLKEKIIFNNNINAKNKNNIKKISDNIYKQIKQNNPLNINKCIDKLNDKIKNNHNHTNTNISKGNKIDSNKRQNINKNKHIIKNNKSNLIAQLYKNIFLIELRDTNNYVCNNNCENKKELYKYSENPYQIDNCNSLIKLKNPFKN